METPKPARICFYRPNEWVRRLEKRLLAQPPVTEYDLVEESLRFVNAKPGAQFEAFVSNALAAWSAVNVAIESEIGTRSKFEELPAFAPVSNEEFLESALMHQEWMRQVLMSTLDAKGRKNDAMPAYIRDRPMDGVVIFERMVGTPRRWRLERRMAFLSIRQFADWAVTLLQEKYADRLCQCQLSICSKFFMAIETGTRTRRLYCSDAHMKEQHTNDAKARVARSREKKRKANL
jgi:predicted RNA-binding Zn ribbon-like protein